MGDETEDAVILTRSEVHELVQIVTVASTEKRGNYKAGMREARRVMEEELFSKFDEEDGRCFEYTETAYSLDVEYARERLSSVLERLEAGEPPHTIELDLQHVSAALGGTQEELYDGVDETNL